ncbi:cupredoxin family copper-binding protein [Paraburkholderia sp. LEh10]|uniref:cupredoxin domain-containing protein n=1 Tax=Paraburkholderia sp. LEh10 TaxID=2821353 RepID=UPI001AE86CAA|nr:cupredoxin family copper-binding protein [Paraburkholderia sp. LEh10]MBP0588332.1 cupredoxin family copper-binding protein [Paraburkholderia sp. LEh10]
MLSSLFNRTFVTSIGRAILIAALASGFMTAQAQDADSVVIKNFMFSPMSLTVKAGSTVTWKNLDGEPHTVVNDAGIFHSAALDENDTYQFKFDKPGVYKVFCGIHPNMKATITVQ